MTDRDAFRNSDTMKPSKQIWLLPLLLTLLFTTSALAQDASPPTTNATAGTVATADVLKPLAGQTVDLILVAGQSNAVGFNFNPAELPADPNDQKVIFWWRCGDPPPDEHDSTSGAQWQQLQPQPRGHPIAGNYGNFSNPAGGFGPEMGLARSLEAKEGKPLAILKVAYNGTALYDSWNPDPAPGGVCYRSLLSEFKLAIQAAQAKGVTLRPRALIWVQGESDCYDYNIPSYVNRIPFYEKELTALVAGLRHELNAPGLIALFGFNTHLTLSSRIVQAQQAVASHDPLCAYVDTSSAPMANSAHFSSAGSLQIGDLFAQALLKVAAPKTP